MERLKVGVLISGRGSNLQALIEAAGEPSYPAEIVLVISNEPKAAGLAHAERAGIPSLTVPHRDYTHREGFEAVLHEKLQEAEIELVCQAGFMRILSPWFVEEWTDRLINIHPSLLPAFSGLGTHARALDAGVKLHGCTVHYVREAVDSGPIIGQAAVPVLPGDDAESLAARVLAAEHRLYPHCLALVAAGRAGVHDEQVSLDASLSEGDALFNPPL